MTLLEAYEAEKAAFVYSAGQPDIYYGYTCNMAVTRELIDRLGSFAPVYRNADVVLVRQAVDALGPAGLAYCDRMRVRRLEVASVWQYLGKLIAYGRDFQRYTKIAGARPLNMRHRLQVFARSVRRNRLGPVRAGLLVILAADAVCYDLMRRVGPPRRSGPSQP